MTILAARLRRCGYKPLTFPYPSLARDLSTNAAALGRFSGQLAAPRIHFVGHSMGGLVIMKMLDKNVAMRAGRSVLLGPPYGGSQAAQALTGMAVGRRILSRSLMECLQGPQVKPERYEFGILAGSRSVGIGRAVTCLPVPNDGVLTVAETRMPNMSDFVELPVSHRIEDFRFHDLRHTWASWHRQAGTSCDELKELGGWKSRNMVDRYAKYATEHLTVAAARIENGRGGNVVSMSRFCHAQKEKRAS